jgi:hypothetical protein
LVPDVETARQLALAHCRAWSSREAVASRYAVETTMCINGSDPMTIQNEIATMASGFMADFPDLV